MARTCAVLGALVVVLLSPVEAAAQSRGVARVEAAAGFRGVAPVHFEPVGAAETTFGGGTRDIFETRSVLATSPGIVVRISARVTSAWWVEASFIRSTTELETRVTGDRDAPNTTVRESINQYGAEVGLALRLGRTSRRFLPFVDAGAGFIRQLHDGHTLARDGWTTFAGGGVEYLLTASTSGTKAVGLRVDSRAVLMHRDIALDGRLHATPLVEATVFVRF
jgi:hypothetical protein